MNVKILINDFATRSFRDVADQDYIAARICYRYELDQQFLWNALQSVEKYFKAILLYNGVSTKNIKHNLSEALFKVESISDIKFNLPNDVKQFIQYLNDFGLDRYLVKPFFLDPKSLLIFDKTVWNIRRYCYNLRKIIISNTGEEKSLLEQELKRIHGPVFEKYPHKFKITGGYLEKLMKIKNNRTTQHLIWKNFYFGERAKKSIKKFPIRASSINPTHFLHPEAFSGIEKLVDFPKKIKNYFQDISKGN